MSFEGGDLLPGCDIPKPSRMIVAAGYEGFVVRRECDSGHVGGVPREGCLLFVFHRFGGRLNSALEDLFHVPPLCQWIHCGRPHRLAVRGKCHSPPAVPPTREPRHFLSPLPVPNLLAVALAAP